MAFFDFFKRKKTKEISKEENIVKDLSFEELAPFLEKKQKEIKVKEKQVISLINEKINLFLENIDEKLTLLTGVDYQSRKVEEKFKLVVKENLANYIYHVRKFKEKLTELKEPDYKEFTFKITRIFSDFDKKSFLNYQKATLLVGKEIASIKEDIVNLSKYFKKIFNENSRLLDFSDSISFISSKIKEINEINKNIEDINEKIKSLEKQEDTKTKDIKTFEEEINKIKESKDYIDNLNKLKEIKSLEERLEKEISELKFLIDFKALSNFFHIIERDMKVVKLHKENFKDSFQIDNGKELLRLLDESKLNNSQTSNKIIKIKDTKENISKITKTIDQDSITSLLNKLENTKIELDKIKQEKENKSMEKLALRKKEILDLINKRVKEL